MSGLIHIYTGNGKGKTTAATGLMVRSLGYNKKVLFVQMQKAIPSGEISIISKFPNVTIVHCTDKKKFYFYMNDSEKEEYIKQHREGFLKAIELIKSESYDLVVFDEIISTVNEKILDIDKLISFLQSKPKNLEVVLTGRNAPKELIDLSDYVSDITCVKHPYDQGIKARKGVEY